jgi:large subunit ribosomal protein L16
MERKGFRKYQKNIKCLKKGNQTSFYSARFALQSLENQELHPKTVEALRRQFTRCLRRKGRVTVRAFPNKPISKKGTESRMGKGKGSVYQWLCRIRRGEIFLEIDGIGVKEMKNVKDLARKIHCKFPGKIQCLWHPAWRKKNLIFKKCPNLI